MAVVVAGLVTLGRASVRCVFQNQASAEIHWSTNNSQPTETVPLCMFENNPLTLDGSADLRGLTVAFRYLKSFDAVWA